MQVCTEFNLLEPVILRPCITGRYHQLDGREQRLEAKRHLFVAGIGPVHLGGGVHVGVGHVRQVLDAGRRAGRSRGADGFDVNIRLYTVAFRTVCIGRYGTYHRGRMGRGVNIKVLGLGAGHVRRRIHGIEIAVILMGGPVEIVVVVAAHGRCVGFTVLGTGFVRAPVNLYSLIVNSLRIVLGKLRLRFHLHHVNVGVGGLHIPVNALIAHGIQDVGLVIARIGSLGGRFIGPHIGFQPKMHHGVIITTRHRLRPLLLLGAGKGPSQRGQQNPIFPKNTSHLHANHFHEGCLHLPSGSQPVRW